MNRQIKVTPVPATVAALLLSGCAAVGPDFKVPDYPTPVSWAQLHADASEPVVIPGDAAPASWSQVNDPQLLELLAKADILNSDIRIAAVRFAQSRGQRALAGAGRAPDLSARVSNTRQKQSAFGASTRILDALGGPNPESLRGFLSAPFDSYDAGFDFSWEVDLWGRVRRSIESADASEGQQEALLQQARLTIRAEVARAYVDMRLAQSQLRSARSILGDSETSLRLVMARSEFGLVSGLDEVQQRGVVAEQRARIPRLQQQETSALNQLALLCGELPGSLNTHLAMGDKGILQLPTPTLDIGLPSELAARRPDIKAALAELHAATADIGVAVADLYPSIRLGATAGFESLTTARFGDWSTRRWLFGPTLEMPIFDGGRRRSVVALRKLEQQEAAVKFQRTVLHAWHEVDSAVAQYNAEQIAHADELERLKSARSSLSVANQRYVNGLTSFAPVLHAQRMVSDAEVAQAQHQARLWSGWFAVLKSIGAEVQGS